MLEDEEQEECDCGGEQVAGGAGEGDEDIVAFVVLEVAGRDGRGLGPAEEHSTVEEADEREDDGAERIEVLEGIEGDAAEHHRCGIAEAHRCPGVGALVDAEGEDEYYDLKQNEDDLLIHIC